MHGLRTTLIGFGAAALLTAVPFAFVAFGIVSPAHTLWIIGLAGVAQIIVHLRVFLGIRLRSGDRERNAALIFAVVLLCIMVGGTLWIMGNLNYRMM